MVAPADVKSSNLPKSATFNEESTTILVQKAISREEMRKHLTAIHRRESRANNRRRHEVSTGRLSKFSQTQFQDRTAALLSRVFNLPAPAQVKIKKPVMNTVALERTQITAATISLPDHEWDEVPEMDESMTIDEAFLAGVEFAIQQVMKYQTSRITFVKE